MEDMKKYVVVDETYYTGKDGETHFAYQNPKIVTATSIIDAKNKYDAYGETTIYSVPVFCTKDLSKDTDIYTLRHIFKKDAKEILKEMKELGWEIF